MGKLRPIVSEIKGLNTTAVMKNDKNVVQYEQSYMLMSNLMIRVDKRSFVLIQVEMLVPSSFTMTSSEKEISASDKDTNRIASDYH